MHFRRTSTALLVVAPFALGAASALGQNRTHVPSANPKIPGVTSPTVLSPELVQIVRAQGSMPVENPTPTVKYYGYLNDHPNMLPALGSNVEASKTEPDKNNYLVLHGLKGAAPTYDYGTHFVFQWHVLSSPRTITRINLDADAAHLITVLANPAQDGVTPLATIDASTWHPSSDRVRL